MTTASMHRTNVCQVCKSSDLKKVLDLGDHPLCDDLIPVGETRVAAEYPIQILLCAHCLTANQAYNVPKEELFGEEYHYRARMTGDVLTGMEQLVSHISGLYGSLSGKKILDIGCNDGSLLSIFAGRGAETYGVEPTGAHRDASAQHRIWPDYFGVDLAKRISAEAGKMDYICFTNVFAHIEDFDDMIGGVRLLRDEHTKVIIENHYLGAVIERNQFDTFYHEHPRTYSISSFSAVAERMGLNLEHVAFPSRYGGNIRVVMGKGETAADLSILGPDESAYFEKFENMSRFIEAWKRDKKREIEELNSQHGPLVAKAFPGRAAILIKLLGLDTQHIRLVAEKPGSMKVGHYVPGTRIPIVDDDTIDYASEGHVLNLAWHIQDEISGYLAGKGFEGELVSIL